MISRLDRKIGLAGVRVPAECDSLRGTICSWSNFGRYGSESWLVRARRFAQPPAFFTYVLRPHTGLHASMHPAGRILANRHLTSNMNNITIVISGRSMSDNKMPLRGSPTLTPPLRDSGRSPVQRPTNMHIQFYLYDNSAVIGVFRKIF